MGREVLALGTRYRALLALLPALLLVGQTYLAASGIVYSLDDPYIHLTLARQISQGHYGINPGEFAAPSSSILWPFMLVPFIFTAAGEFAPLAINLASLLITLWWLQRWFETVVPLPWATLATVVAAFCFNLYGLPLTGMEHSLQVMLVVIVALSLVQERIAWPFWLSVTLLPFIRYEGLAISLPALAYLAAKPERRLKAVISGAAIVCGVGGFSAFLYGNGVGLLPASVMQRDAVSFSHRFPDIARIVDNVEALFYFVAIAAFAGVLYMRQKRGFAALVLLAAPIAAHLMFGLYGDAGRYHIYVEVWVAIAFLSLYARRAWRAACWSISCWLRGWSRQPRTRSWSRSPPRWPHATSAISNCRWRSSPAGISTNPLLSLISDWFRCTRAGTSSIWPAWRRLKPCACAMTPPEKSGFPHS